MVTKNKMIKMAKICHIVSKVLYITACVVCLVFISLAIALSVTNAVSTLTAAETAVLFGTLALYAFVCIGLLWNVDGIFKSIVEEKSPFSESVSHYLKKVAIYVLIISVVPALIGSVVIRLVYPATELTFPIEVGGIVAGIVLFLIGMFFKYGKELQKQDDETL